jgi:formate-dependent nitrite reductase cytochrome c552 subunit
MRAWSAALGVTCAHCHVTDVWTDSSKPAFEFAQRMTRMVNALNTGPLKDLGGVTCWTCHRGQTRPARLPRAQWEEIQSRHSAEFASKPGRALAMSVYSASLGVDCMHCHEPETWEASSKRAFAMVNRMLPVFEEIPKHFDKARMPQTQCYMCHQGKVKPEREAK